MQLDVGVLQSGSDSACDNLVYRFAPAPAHTPPPLGLCATFDGFVWAQPALAVKNSITVKMSRFIASSIST